MPTGLFRDRYTPKYGGQLPQAEQAQNFEDYLRLHGLAVLITRPAYREYRGGPMIAAVTRPARCIVYDSRVDYPLSVDVRGLGNATFPDNHHLFIFPASDALKDMDEVTFNSPALSGTTYTVSLDVPMIDRDVMLYQPVRLVKKTAG